MKKILVTGGQGFVGSALLRRLRSCNKWNILAPTAKELDLLDFQQTNCFLKEHPVDIVVHLAAKLGSVATNQDKSLAYLEDNLLINYNIVKACSTFGVMRFITLGSSCSYANDLPHSACEEDLWRGKPENTYGIAKLVLLEHLATQQSMQWSYLIPPNLYGPGDIFKGPAMRLIPATITKFIGAKQSKANTINVWGDGTQERDFIYIENLIDILLYMLMQEDALLGVFNVSTGMGTSVKQIISIIQSEMGLEEMAIDWDITKPTGTIKKVLCNDRLMRIHPFPLITITQGLRETLQWYGEQESRV